MEGRCKAVTHLGRRCIGRVTPTLGSGFNCGDIVRVPGLSGIIVGITYNRTGSGRGVLRTIVGSLNRVANRGTIIYHTGGDITGFGLHRNAPVNYGIALHNRHVCRFISHFFGITLPHIHSFHNVGNGNFSNHNGFTYNVGRRVVFPRVSFSGISTIHNVSIYFIAATGASRRNGRLLGTLNTPFTARGGWKKS